MTMSEQKAPRTTLQKGSRGRDPKSRKSENGIVKISGTMKEVKAVIIVHHSASPPHRPPDPISGRPLQLAGSPRAAPAAAAARSSRGCGVGQEPGEVPIYLGCIPPVHGAMTNFFTTMLLPAPALLVSLGMYWCVRVRTPGRRRASDPQAPGAPDAAPPAPTPRGLGHTLVVCMCLDVYILRHPRLRRRGRAGLLCGLHVRAVPRALPGRRLHRAVRRVVPIAHRWVWADVAEEKPQPRD